MVRRSAHTVLQTSQRLVQAGVGTTPVWHAALLSHPPAPIRPVFKSSVKELVFPEDRIRTQFFEDFPFEAMRAKSLAERQVVKDEDRLQGKEWYSLHQRTSNPSAEDCIAFTLNLQKYHKLSLAKAYAIATAQFADLRAVQEVAIRSAYKEARSFGAHSDPKVDRGEVARTNKKMENALRSWRPPRSLKSSSGSKIWQADAQPSYHALEGKFSGGADYIQGWSSWNEWTDGKRQRLLEGARLRGSRKASDQSAPAGSATEGEAKKD
ncbi:Mitochondrial ribosomal protein S25 [Phaffia rhodozyma]|uniref:Small ribosomal subunit protein mS23 n=1 Tax=Phaffia rhodozyma TaxID=264483 RepID=A0A0F7SF42_PHARH|nr:Mitochondrial ribosomal protein S25 [Phaffia rhodozyma]